MRALKPQALAVLLAVASAVPVASAREAPLSCDDDSHQPFVVQCDAMEKEFILLVGNNHRVVCDPEREQIVVVVGNDNSVTC